MEAVAVFGQEIMIAAEPNTAFAAVFVGSTVDTDA